MSPFPQLTSGAAVQYPLTREHHVRTVMNVSPDGTVYRYGDAPDASVLWELRYEDLSDAEAEALTSFFDACAGSLRTFVFLDPAGNLLSYSEDLAAADWAADPLLEISGNAADPLGTTRATTIRNTAQSSQWLEQTLGAPGAYTYCFSCYVRGGVPGTVNLRMTSGGDTLEAERQVSAEWRRILLAGELSAGEESVCFGLGIPAGAEVDVFGLQAEPQPGPSEYKKTTGSGGVYPRSRFRDDTVLWTSHGPGRHSATIRVVSPIESQ